MRLPTYMVRITAKRFPLFFKACTDLFPGIALGTLTGTIVALVLPSIFVIGSLAWQKFLLQYSAATKGVRFGAYLRSTVKPEHFAALLFAGAGVCIAVNSLSLWRLSVRCYKATATEGAVLWGVSTYAIWTADRPPQRVFLMGAVVALTVAIASVRTAEEEVQPLLSSDRPVGKNEGDDELDRTRIADSLVERVITDDIPVLAIVGAYGDGKTTLLEMMASRLIKRGAIIVRFKTSLPGDESTLVSSLFNSIAKELHHRFFVGRLRVILRRYARTLAGVVPSMPKGVKEVFKAPSQEDDLTELSARLERLSVDKVIVLLDDMDRMQPGELRMLLKVIRGIENYPKLCFICAFNKDALVEAVVRLQAVDWVTLDFTLKGATPATGTVAGEIKASDIRNGYEYLEKFFPVQIPVPKLDHKQLARQFDKHFEEFASHYGLLTLPDEQKAFEERFSSLWISVFRPALHNVRRMKTFFNSLKLAFRLVRDEVDLIDFMCIELLRQEEPVLYEAIYEYRVFFYFPAWDVELFSERDINDNHAKEQHTRAFDELFRPIQGIRRGYLLAMISEMFPKVEHYRAGAEIDLRGNEELADGQKRICHPSHFMVYFSLHVPEGYYGTQEFKQVLSCVNEREHADAEAYFQTYLRNLEELKRVRFFERVTAAQATVDEQRVKALAAAIARESQILRIADFGIGDFHAAIRTTFVIANRFNRTDEIMNILTDAISNSSTDAFAQRILAFSVDHEHNSLIENWAHVNDDVLRAEFAGRMKRKYYKGGAYSIYDAPSYHHWQALISWYRIRPDDAREYLADEFERRPQSIGKHLLWLFPSITSSLDGKKFVDEMFPFTRLKALAVRFGEQAYSGDPQKRVVQRLINDDMEGGWPY